MRSTRRRTSRPDFVGLSDAGLQQMSAQLRELVSGLSDAAHRARAGLLPALAQFEAELIRRGREAKRVQQVGQYLGYVFHLRFAMGVG